MEKKIPLVWLLIFCLTLGLTGCIESIRKEKTDSAPGLLEPQPAAKFGDIPIPAGFKLLPEASYSFENSGLRVGLLKYRGKADPEHVINFYKEQMPIYNWSLLNIIEYGERLLNFERENEICNISLLVKGSSITITISVGPKSQGPAKKAKFPLK